MRTTKDSISPAARGRAQRTLILTGTLNGGYADELYNMLFRLNPKKMLEEGFAYGDAGMRAFSEAYGVLEKITHDHAR